MPCGAQNLQSPCIKIKNKGKEQIHVAVRDTEQNSTEREKETSNDV